MERNWSTTQAPPAHALAYWRDVVCKNLLELQIDTARRTDFFGSISQLALGPFTANFISVSEQRVWRTGKTCARGQKRNFHLIQVRDGLQQTRQGGDQTTLAPGESIVVDCMSSFEFAFPEGVKALVLEIDRDWLKGWLPTPEHAVGRVFRAQSGWSQTLSSALNNVTPESLEGETVPATSIAEQIASLLALASGPAPETMSTHKRGLLKRVTDSIRERCHERELDPATLAASLRLSRRYLHLLLSSAGTTFSQELYRCRLQRAERILRDPRFLGIGVAEVAWDCGFSGPSHFTRRFREAYGVPPSSYRPESRTH